MKYTIANSIYSGKIPYKNKEVRIFHKISNGNIYTRYTTQRITI